MAVNTDPIFPKAPVTPVVEVTSANTDRTGATAAGLEMLVAGDTDGTKVYYIGFKAQDSTTTAYLLIFLSEASGVNKHIITEVAIPAVATPSATVPSATGGTVINIQLQPTQEIWVGVTALSGGDAINVYALAGSYTS